MLLSPHIQGYADSQYQNEAPIGAQPPIPAGIHNIELSWDRHTGYMRIIINGQKWYFKALLGRAVVLGTDSERGRINLRSMARINDETLTLYRPPDAQPHWMVEDRFVAQRLEPTHNRLCYRRETKQWRIRDERKDWNDPEALKFTANYVGDLVCEWEAQDRAGHVFHNGFAVIDNQNVCHLYDERLTHA